MCFLNDIFEFLPSTGKPLRTLPCSDQARTYHTPERTFEQYGKKKKKIVLYILIYKFYLLVHFFISYS